MTRRRRRMRKSGPKELQLRELGAILDRTKTFLSEEDPDTPKAAVQNLELLRQQLGAEGTSIARVRRRLFGPTAGGTQPAPGDTSEDEEAGEDLRANRVGQLRGKLR